jgi:hypothetical protein
MSQNDLVNAYLEGRVTRRTLIRRLVAGGVSLGAALSYAELLRPQRASASSIPNHYPVTSVKIRSSSIQTVLTRDRLAVTFSSDEDLKPFWVRAYLLKHGQPSALIAYRQFNQFTGPDTAKLKIPLTVAGRVALQGRTRAKVTVIAQGIDDENGTHYYVPSPSDTKTLTA